MLIPIITQLAAADQAARDPTLSETERKHNLLLAAGLVNYLIKIQHFRILEVLALVEAYQRGDLDPTDD